MDTRTFLQLDSATDFSLRGSYGRRIERQPVTFQSLASALKQTSAMILAGGQGERLTPLTRDRAKPAVPFGGNYRIIDFPLSNCLNSGIRKIHILTH